MRRDGTNGPFFSVWVPDILRSRKSRCISGRNRPWRPVVVFGATFENSLDILGRENQGNGWDQSATLEHHINDYDTR